MHQPKGAKLQPCSTYPHFKLVCRHQLLCIGAYKPSLLNDDKDIFLASFFHPAYLLSNAMLMYAKNDIDIIVPSASFGAPPTDVIDLIESDEDDEGEGHDRMKYNMLPPLK